LSQFSTAGEKSPAATGNVTYYVYYNLWTFLVGVYKRNCKGKVKITDFRSLFKLQSSTFPALLESSPATG
jgi:hypothetical protein